MKPSYQSERFRVWQRIAGVFGVAALSLSCVVSAQAGTEFTAEVTRVSSGHILTLNQDGQNREAIVDGVECPPSTTPIGAQAKQFVKDSMLGKSLTFVLKSDEGASISYVEVRLPDGRLLNEVLVESGYAICDETRAAAWKKLHELEKEARSAQRGLWSDQATTVETLTPMRRLSPALIDELTRLGKENLAAQREEIKQTNQELDARYAKAAAERTRQEAKRQWERKLAQWREMSAIQRQIVREELSDEGERIKKKLKVILDFAGQLEDVGDVLSEDSIERRRFIDRWRAVAMDGASAGFNELARSELEAHDRRRQLAETDVNQAIAEYNQLVDDFNAAYLMYELKCRHVAALDKEIGASDGEASTKGGQGSGFVVGSGGFIMTCAHVVGSSTDIKVRTQDGNVHVATVVKNDEANDWCLLRAGTVRNEPIPIAQGAELKVGAPLFCLGFPLSSLLDNVSPIAASGNLASLQGLGGDIRHLQISIPLNPGSSGSPILDEHGCWVGLASHKLNDVFGLVASGSLPQGFNFAVKSSFIQTVATGPVGFKFAENTQTKKLSLEQIVERTSESIVKVVTDSDASAKSAGSSGTSQGYLSASSSGFFEPGVAPPMPPEEGS